MLGHDIRGSVVSKMTIVDAPGCVQGLKDGTRVWRGLLSDHEDLHVVLLRLEGLTERW